MTRMDAKTLGQHHNNLVFNLPTIFMPNRQHTVSLVASHIAYSLKSIVFRNIKFIFLKSMIRSTRPVIILFI